MDIFRVLKMTNPAIDTGIKQYLQEKPAGDLDLVSIVREKMINFELKPLVEANFDTNHFIIEANGKHSTAQRYLLNRYWSIQLMTSNKPSTEERYCLIPNGTVEDWLKLWTTKVLPFIVENNLPSKV